MHDDIMISFIGVPPAHLLNGSVKIEVQDSIKVVRRIISKQNTPSSGFSRREFLGMSVATAVASMIPSAIYATATEPQPEKMIYFHNVYTLETLETVYWKDGKYIPEALNGINHLFRDVRTGKVRTISKRLIDLLYDLQQEVKTDEPFQMISGYRTPRSNALLSKIKKGVAKNSLHIYGKAVDIRLPDYSLSTLRRKAMKLQGGGVGYYPHSNFIHVDVGSVRYWRG